MALEPELSITIGAPDESSEAPEDGCPPNSYIPEGAVG